MQSQGTVQKWGNSSAIRLPATLMAAAGIKTNDEVDIQASDGRLVIQLHERTNEQAFDNLLAQEPATEDVLALVKKSITQAVAMTEATTKQCYELIERLDQQESP